MPEGSSRHLTGVDVPSELLQLAGGVDIPVSPFAMQVLALPAGGGMKQPVGPGRSALLDLFSGPKLVSQPTQGGSSVG